jgi:hypothetical protein
MTVLIGDRQLAELQALRARAVAHPVDMRDLLKRLATQKGKAAHMRQMTKQTVELPVGMLVTFSLEVGHPCGTARHLSVSVSGSDVSGKLPHPLLVWEVATELGFWGSLEQCALWPEQLQGHGQAINLVQPVESPSTESRH